MASSGETDGKIIQSPPLCREKSEVTPTGMQPSRKIDICTRLQRRSIEIPELCGEIAAKCSQRYLNDLAVQGSTHRPVGWGGHLLVGCQLQGVNNSQNLTAGGQTEDGGVGHTKREESSLLKVPPSGGRVKQREFQLFIWSNHEYL